MTKSNYASRLDEIQNIIKPLLVARSFKQQNRSFTRSVETGLVQVVAFGMAGSTSSYYGKFTVDIGVYIEEVYLHYHSWEKKPPRKISTSHCEITRRLPTFLPGVEDKWWELSGPIGEIVEELSNLLLNYGLPFLESLLTRKSIIEKSEIDIDFLGLPPRGKTSMAIVNMYLGHKDKAEALLKSELEQNLNKPYSKFIREVLTDLGFSIEM